jgi:ectoine hydroxylase-related dioxygenase (phytanoyl-CoA dioxygenase family)
MQRFDSGAGVDQVVAALDEHGYAVVDGIMSPAQVAEARRELEPHLAATPLGRNTFEGHRTRRVYALFAKVRAFDDPATHPLILGVLDRVLGQYQFSAPVAIDIGPGEAAQVLHRDDSVYPIARPHQELVVNTMWPLDEFTTANGATRLLPGSHRDPGDEPPAGVDPILATLSPGSVMIYLGSLWHGGGANQTDRPRLGVIVEYVASWLRPQETHLLAVPPEVVAALPSRLQELLGYNIYPPFLGYVDGRHPRRALDLRSESWQPTMSPHTG